MIARVSKIIYSYIKFAEKRITEPTEMAELFDENNYIR